MKIGKNITALRKKLGLSQEQFANELGVSRQIVGMWETDKSVPSADKIQLIRETFDVKYDEIFDGTVREKVRENYVENSAKRKWTKQSILMLTSVLIFATAAVIYVLRALGVEMNDARTEFIYTTLAVVIGVVWLVYTLRRSQKDK